MTDDKNLYGGKYETFAEWVKAEPDKFDSQDCRPGPSGLDPEYSDSLIPDNIKERTMEVRRARRAAEEAEFDRAIKRAAKQKPKDDAKGDR